MLHPEGLLMARKMVIEGESAFERELGLKVAKKQSATWNWLRDMAEAGQLASFATGKYVVAWKPEAQPTEILVVDNPVDGVLSASQHWLIPTSLLAVTHAGTAESNSDPEILRSSSVVETSCDVEAEPSNVRVEIGV